MSSGPPSSAADMAEEVGRDPERGLSDYSQEEADGNNNNTAVTRLREPLIRHPSFQHATTDGSDNASSSSGGSVGEGSVAVALLCTAVSVWGSFEFGTCIGYSAPTQRQIIDELGLSLSQFSIFGSILTIGAMVGAITSGTIADFIGRKGAMRLSSIFCLIGWLSIYLSKDVLLLYLGRLSTGFGIGIFSYVVPIFIAEISPHQLRGGLTTANQLMICTGSSVAYIVGIFVPWRSLVFAGVIPCILLLLGLFVIPESPRWLAKVGNRRDFEASLQRLRGKNADITQESCEIQEYLDTVQCLPKARVQDLFQKQYFHPVIVGVGLMVFQQLDGVNGILFYAGQVFVTAGFSSADLGTFLMGLIQVPITIVGAILLDRSGRKPLIMISAAGTFLGSFLTGLAFLLQGQGLFLHWVPTMALSGILVYIGAYSLGLGSIPWVIMSEVFPPHIKGIGGSLVVLVNWFGSWLICYAFNFLLSWSSSGTFFMFSAASALTILFVAKVVPETKGKTLEEIQASMKK